MVRASGARADVVLRRGGGARASRSICRQWSSAAAASRVASSGRACSRTICAAKRSAVSASSATD
eukprot:7115415-Prymnesium_polylepis.1